MRRLMFSTLLVLLLMPFASAGFSITYRAGNTAEITSGQTHATLGAAIQHAHDLGWSRIQLPRGTHEIGAVPEISGVLDEEAIPSLQDGIQIIIPRGTKITNDPEGPIGWFNITAPKVFICGEGELEVTTFVADQEGLVVDGGLATEIDGLTFRASADDGVTTDPMSLMRVKGESGFTSIRNCTFLPNVAISCGWSDGSNIRTEVSNCQFRNEDPGQVQNPGGDNFLPRNCWEVWRSVSEGWFAFSDNFVWGLGEGDDDGPIPEQILNKCVFIQVGTDANEDGHIVVEGNYFEEVAARNLVEFAGGNHGIVRGNTFANPDGANNTYNGTTRFDAALRFDSSDGTNPGVVCARIMVVGNEFHRPAEDTGLAIAVARTKHIQIVSNSFYLLQTSNQIFIDSSTVENPVIQSNTFDGDSTGGTDTCVLYSGSAPTVYPSQFNLVCSGNYAEQFTAANPFMSSVLGVYFPFGVGFDAGLQIGPSENLIAFNNEGTITGTGLFTNAVVGHVFHARVTNADTGVTMHDVVQTLYTVTARTNDQVTVTPAPAIDVVADTGDATDKLVTLRFFPKGVNTNVIFNQTTAP